MLALLEAHGRSLFGDVAPSRVKKGKGKDKAVEVETEEAGEWGGIEEDADEEGDGSEEQDDEFDDGEDLMASALSGPQARASTSKTVSSTKPSRPAASSIVPIVFQDPSRRTDDPASALGQAGRRAFMAAQVNKPVGEATGKKRKSREGEAEEAHLQSLDRSLASLITTFNASDGPGSTSKLQSLLSTRLTAGPTGGDDPLNRQLHGRRLRASLAASKLSRLQRADEEARQSGTVRAKSAGAATLREKRREQGDERRERKKRRGIGGGVGQERGGEIRLSKDEIARMRQRQRR